MAKYELTIYGENDEIIKKHETNDVKWGVYLEAAKISDEMEDMTAAEQIQVVNEFAKRMFIGLTDDELNCAYGDDVMNVFNQLIKKSKSIGGSKKRASGGEVTAATTLHFELMKTTFILAQNFNVTPFEIMAQDMDDVIMVINYLCDCGAESKAQKNSPIINDEKEQDKSFWSCF